MTKLLIKFTLIYIALGILAILIEIVFGILVPFVFYILFGVLAVEWAGELYAKEFEAKPDKAICWKFAFLAVLIMWIIVSPLLLIIFPELVGDYFELNVPLLSFESIILLVFATMQIVFARFLFEWAAQWGVATIKRKKRLAAEKRASRSIPLAEKNRRTVQQILWTQYVAACLYLSIFGIIYYWPRMLDVTGINEVVRWFIDTWQPETYRSLFNISETGFPLLLYQFFVTTILFWVAYVPVLICFLINGRRAYFGSILKDERILYGKTGFFGILVLRIIVLYPFFGFIFWIYFTTPQAMLGADEFFSPDLSGVIMFGLFTVLMLFLFKWMIDLLLVDILTHIGKKKASDYK
jgi:hypothetical protein